MKRLWSRRATARCILRAAGANLPVDAHVTVDLVHAAFEFVVAELAPRQPFWRAKMHYAGELYQSVPNASAYPTPPGIPAASYRPGTLPVLTVYWETLFATRTNTPGGLVGAAVLAGAHEGTHAVQFARGETPRGSAPSAPHEREAWRCSLAVLCALVPSAEGERFSYADGTTHTARVEHSYEGPRMDKLRRAAAIARTRLPADLR